MERPMVSTLQDQDPRVYYIRGFRWYVRVTFSGQHWTAVELDEFGGFRRRLYDGREDGRPEVSR